MEFQKLQEIIVDVLNVTEDEITMETTFVDDLGADSLDIFQIIMGIEETFDIEIENEDAEKIVTVGDAVCYIAPSKNEKDLLGFFIPCLVYRILNLFYSISYCNDFFSIFIFDFNIKCFFNSHNNLENIQ